MARIWEVRKGYSGTPVQTSTGIYGLKGLERKWTPRVGYQFTSEKYPTGVPRTIGRFTVGVPPSAAATARALSSSIPSSRAAAMLISRGTPAITAGNIIRDPKRVKSILEGGSGLLSTPAAQSSTSGFVPLPSASVSPATLGGGAIAPVDIGGMGGLTGITTGMASVGSGILNTVKQYIPLIVIGGIAILGIKMLMGRR